MKSRLASIRSPGGVDRVNCAVQLLEDEWQRHGEVVLEQFWSEQRSNSAVDSSDAVAVLAELVKADLRCRFERGQAPTAAEYLERFPELRAADSRVLSLVYEEYCLNEERGTAPDVDTFCNRYPDWKSSLASQLQYHHLLSEAAGRRPSLPAFPEAGQDFEEFRLQSLLGTGGMSRVFVARDLSLGGKKVVLKVTVDRGQEPKVQGPLDHPHIVPVNSVVYQAEGPLCGLSMPYRPGLPLDEVIARVNPATRPRKAIVFWNALVSASGECSRASTVDEADTDQRAKADAVRPRGDGWEGFPVRGTYAQGVAWIVMIYARALHYAHRMQTYHRDVKPGNLLLTIQTGPQLLDFNLAESPHAANHATAALHGGTLPYMAPEQIEAFIDPDLWGKVGARADVYSLGLVLRELLTGQKPELPAPGLPAPRALRAVLDRRPFIDVTVRRYNPAIPHAVEAIVAKCLTYSPDDRYPDAQHLEEDLDRFLKYQPLKHATNPSRGECATNWMMRRRRALSSAACVIVVGALLFGVWRLRPPIETSPKFRGALEMIKSGAFERAIKPLLELEKVDPNSCLVKFYLSLALNEDANRQADADRYLRKALPASDADRKLLEWSKHRDEVGPYLLRFAESRIDRADIYAQKIDIGSSISDDERDSEYRVPTYELASDALRLAYELDPTSQRLQYLVAKTERMNGKYASAYERLSNVISTIKADKKPDDAPLLISCYMIRGWVAFLWAEHDPPQKRDDETQNRLIVATKDLYFCGKYLDNCRVDHHERKVYHVMHDRLRATVTLAEVELDLLHVDAGKKSYTQAAEMLQPLRDYIKGHELNVPKTDDLEKRLDAVETRLIALKALAPRVPASPIVAETAELAGLTTQK
jgi:serine/threonine protein kinase